MSLLLKHLEQISACSDSIASLPFPPPQIFTNALLSPHDITALIRDTEPHERALFSVPPPASATEQSQPATAPEPKASTRRQTVFNVQSGEITAGNTGTSRVQPRRNTAVAAVLGKDLDGAIKRGEREKGEVDVEVLLHGAEKLLEVYGVEGVRERITLLRTRYSRARGNLRSYSSKVAELEREVERINRGGGWDEEDDDDDDLESAGGKDEMVIDVTDDDLRAEEEEIRELERRKKDLEMRVEGMEKDLGGLLR